MKAAYVQAFLELIREGVSIETILSGLRQTLASKSHTKLWVPILREVLRTLESDKGISRAIVRSASKQTAEKLQMQIFDSLKELEVPKDTVVQTVVDETLIGGFVTTFNYREYDQSYKRALTSLYESIIK